MKDIIQNTLEHAEALYEELRRVGKTLGKYEGKQVTEARTEQQLDRWTRERAMEGAVDAAIVNMDKVLSELRWIRDGLED